mgnify:FL=1
MVTREPSVCYCPVVMGAQATVYLVYAWIRGIRVSQIGVASGGCVGPAGSYVANPPNKI